MKRVFCSIAAGLVLIFYCNAAPFNYIAVDLGLSVKWANANIGAVAPEAYGYYYAWGETEPKYDYNWASYKWREAGSFTKYCNTSVLGEEDNKVLLDPGDDIAHVILGGRWRMPTPEEIEELVSTRDNKRYKWEWVSINGHNGWRVTYLVNGNSIFLPAAGFRYDNNNFEVGSSGYYWSSHRSLNPQDRARRLVFDSYTVYKNVDYYRYCGYTVRPVFK